MPRLRSTVGTVPQKIVFAPSTSSAKRYNDPLITQAPVDALGDGMYDHVQRAAAVVGKAAPLRDGRLYRAVQDLADIAPDSGPIDYNLIEFAMQRQGIIEPSPHLIVIRGPASEPVETTLAGLEENLPGIIEKGNYNRFGAGRAYRKNGAELVAILALQSSYVVTSPMPRSLPRGGTVKIEGRVSGAFVDPEIYITNHDGTVESPTMARAGRTGFRAAMSCRGRKGKQQIEITASDSTGSTVMANFPVWCNADMPQSITIDTSVDMLAPARTVEQAESQTAQLINRDRVRHGLPPLQIDARLVPVARAHSTEMRETGIVGHVSPTTGSASDRVRGAGIRTAVVLENVGRAYGVSEAQAGFMNSPGHRANVLSKDATHMGIGIVFGDTNLGARPMYITQLYSRVPQKLDVRQARAQVAKLIKSRRDIGEDGSLRMIAQQFAAELSRGRSSQQAYKKLTPQLQKLQGRFSGITTLATTVADITAFDPTEALADGKVSHYGLGVAQGDHEVMGDGAISIVLLLGHR